MLQITLRDERVLGVVRQPALAMSEQLLDFRLPDPVVLVVVQDRDQHVQVR